MSDRAPWAARRTRNEQRAVAQSDSGTGRKARPAGPFRRFLAVLGPGLIAGASDNDPTTVATLAVIGAATGYALAWLILLILPMLLVVQVVSARLGLVSRKSMEGLIRERWGNGWAVLAMALVLIVNLFTIGADLEGGAAALGLLTRLDWKWFVLPLAALLGALLTFGTFKQVERVLRYVLLVFLAYLVAAIGAHPDWPDVIHHTLIPSFQFTAEYTAAALALLGTTLTDYVYVWQTIEMEEAHPSLNELPLVQLDAAAGIVTTVLLFWSIVVSTGATLGVQGKAVETAQDAAAALQPVAGPFAGDLFAVGLLASAVLSLPILAATSAYVLSQLRQWQGSLDQPPRRATWQFYAVLLGSLALGAAMSVAGVAPIHLLFLAGVVGGLGTPALLAMLMLLATSQDVMGGYRIRGAAVVVGWSAVGAVSLAGLAYLWQQFL